jgi:DNA-binding NarL/FixJ family response regulator
LQGLEQKHREHRVFDHIQTVPRLKSEVEQLHSAHTSLYNSLKRQQDSADLVRNDLQKTQVHMTKVIEQYNKCFNTVFDQLKAMREELDTQQKAPAQPLISQVSHTKSESLAPNYTPQAAKPVTTVRDMATGLTTSERQIMSILMSTSQKLSYKDIAVTYGRSPSTIKNIVCRIKSKGVPLHETAGSDGIKRYYLDDNFKKVLTQGRV